MKFIDWFANGSVYVVDLALACCGIESGAAMPVNAPVRAAIPDGTPIVVIVSGTVTTRLAPVVREAINELKRNHPVDVVAFGACACAGGPYWDSASVVCGLHGLGIDADHWIPGCPPGPDALTEVVSSSREAA
ncbi:proton-conducting membrane transporter [Cutibacterium sp. WCA-380-WT-3A]|uniref:Proton-conducting membrane transporter n=1 Tax=Cutibacterium porci TaxID=2605781 RepID=A0A7K0J882_9ACTN|nr:proton-conducting membrane transporter [Cutibacterium porci]MSS46150.1 proton-conducting membrane transporter [Cutibacterium porci]